MSATLRTYRLFIDGTWVDGTGDEENAVISPSTEEVIGSVPQASIADVEEAVAAARFAFDDGPWPRMAPKERSRVLVAFAEAIAARRDELIELIIDEAGSARPIAESLQFDAPLGHAFWFAERAATFPYLEPLPPVIASGAIGQGMIAKEPVGVVAAITAFNFPVYLNLWKLFPALAMGNTVVLKPSPYTPLEAFVLAEIAQEVGLPPGTVNVVTGDLKAAETLTTHPAVDMVSFTGSDQVGRAIQAQAAEGLKKVLLELGGKSPSIVFAGADVAKAARSAAGSFIRHAGQGCGLTTRVLAERAIYDELIEAMTAILARVTVGDPHDPATVMGPLIRETQRARVERYVESGKQQGARLAFGGGRPAGLDRGFYVEPTLFVDVDNAMNVAQDEIFGPVSVVIPFEGEDEAVAIANDSRFGLAASVWHAEPVRALEVARRIKAGRVAINGGGPTMNPHGAWGGFKHSGLGRELGDYGLLEYVELKTIEWGAGKP
ncbi:MAG: aldehyde dehydrogenase family protein [Actinomycetota bacterium]